MYMARPRRAGPCTLVKQQQKTFMFFVVFFLELIDCYWRCTRLVVFSLGFHCIFNNTLLEGDVLLLKVKTFCSCSSTFHCILNNTLLEGDVCFLNIRQCGGVGFPFGKSKKWDYLDMGEKSSRIEFWDRFPAEAWPSAKMGFPWFVLLRCCVHLVLVSCVFPNWCHLIWFCLSLCCVCAWFSYV